MSYATCRDALKTALTGLAAGITSGDSTPLDGGIDSLIVLYPGTAAGGDLQSMQPYREWGVNVQVITRYQANEADTFTAFETLRDSVTAVLSSAPDMGGLIYIEDYAADGDPFYLYDKQGGGPFHLGQSIAVTMREAI